MTSPQPDRSTAVDTRLGLQEAGGPAWWAYRWTLRLATPLYLARLWWRGAREPGYRQAMSQRLGYCYAPAQPGAVWIHAVSLGETRAAAPLIDALRAAQPGMRLLLTHGTATGRQAGAELLQAGDMQTWLPWDTPGAVRRFLRHHRPAVGVLMETEIWPTLLTEAARAGVPMVLANARLSERSARRGARLSALMRPAAATVRLVLAQTDADAARLAAAGARAVEVCGNLKYDIAPSTKLLVQGRAWRAAAGGRAIVIAANTRDGEEAALLDAWRQMVWPYGAAPLLLIVPRHPQRFDAVAALIAADGRTLARRSAWSAVPPPEAAIADVWLGDSLGELPAYYAASDIGLLGGSYAPLGGHNLIEAAASGCPLLIGPSTFNFEQAATDALAAGIAWRVADFSAAVQQLQQLIGSAELTQAAARTRAHAAAYGGAAARSAARVLSCIAA